jgi:hypothetical protein
MSYTDSSQLQRPYLSPKEVELEFGIPATTLAFWRKAGVGSGPVFLRFGRRIKYRRIDIDAWIREQNPDV